MSKLLVAGDSLAARREINKRILSVGVIRRGAEISRFAHFTTEADLA